MSTFFLFGAVAQCPKCEGKRFSGGPELTPTGEVTCVRCGHICKIEDARRAGIESGVIKKLPDEAEF